jgi:YVTN family beta-propeller protein
VANSTDSSVSTYAVDAATGRLKFAGKAQAGTGPLSVTIHPGGKYAYVANSGSNTISQYTIGTNGSLTAMLTPTVAAGDYPRSITFHPGGTYAYVANMVSGDISLYTIGLDGSLTSLATPTISAGTWPTSVTVDPGGKNAYVANYNSDEIFQYTIRKRRSHRSTPTSHPDRPPTPSLSTRAANTPTSQTPTAATSRSS